MQTRHDAPLKGAVGGEIGASLIKTERDRQTTELEL